MSRVNLAKATKKYSINLALRALSFYSNMCIEYNPRTMYDVDILYVGIQCGVNAILQLYV